MHLLRRLLAVLAAGALLLPVSLYAADSTAWYSPDWKYRQKITVNHEQVAGPVDGFPMLVRLSGKVFEQAQPDGNDILFTTADGTTKLLHEIESMDGEVVAWVQMPHLSEKVDTVLYVYYGNPLAKNQQSPTNVWGNGYFGVWHMNQSAADIQQDATIGDSDATPTGLDTTEDTRNGKVAGAVDFDGGHPPADYAGAQKGPGVLSSMTLSLWLNADRTVNQLVNYPLSVGTSAVQFWSIGITGNYSEPDLAARSIFFHDSVVSSSALTDAWTDATDTNVWRHIAIVYDKNANPRTRIFKDGKELVKFSDSISGDITANNLVMLGARGDPAWGLDGVVDEARFSTVARSGAWIKTEYNNQSESENFFTIAVPETQSATTPAAANGTSPVFSPMIQAINQLYRTAYNRGPTFAEWKLWADRVIAGEKPTFPELLGAMQWQNLFGN